MAKILDSANIDVAISKVIELDKGYIINGHYYRKNTLTPIPLKLFPIQGNIYDLKMERAIYPTATKVYHNDNSTPTVIKDKYDPNVVYKIGADERNNRWFIAKFLETDTSVEMINIVNYEGSSPAYDGNHPHQYAGQNERYIWFVFTSYRVSSISSSTYGASYLVRIDKKTLKMTSHTLDSSHSLPKVLYEDDTWIYLTTNLQYQNHTLRRYNKETYQFENLGIQNRAGVFSGTVVPTDLIDVDENIKVYYSMSWDNDNLKFYFIKYTINLAEADPSLMVTEEEIPIIWNDEIAEGIVQFPTESNMNRYDLFIYEAENGELYLNLVMYQISNVDNNNGIPVQGIYTFAVRDTTLEIVNYSQVIEGQIMKGFLLSRDKKFMIIATKIAVIFLSFDETVGGYVVNDVLDIVPHSVGIDSFDNVWITRQDTTVEMISLTIPTVVDIAFKDTDYLYEGSDIETAITIEAKNYQGANISIALDLTIDGNAVFTSNGKKIAREVTSTEGKVEIPITITGAGNIAIYPKFVASI